MRISNLINIILNKLRKGNSIIKYSIYVVQGFRAKQYINLEGVSWGELRNIGVQPETYVTNMDEH